MSYLFFLSLDGLLFYDLGLIKFHESDNLSDRESALMINCNDYFVTNLEMCSIIGWLQIFLGWELSN